MYRYQELLKIWMKYTDCFCVSNEWLKEPLFWVLNSQLLRATFTEGGVKRPLREHFFCVQGARTGKGRAMRAAKHMFMFFNREEREKRERIAKEALNKINLEMIGLDESKSIENTTTSTTTTNIDLNSNAEFYNKFDENTLDEEGVFNVKELSGEVTLAALVGGIEYESHKGKVSKIIKKGMLEKYNYLCWEEGGDLVAPRNLYGNLKSTILNALEDASPITRSARKDLNLDGSMSSFYSHTSVATGTVLIPEITKDFQASGMLQRFLFSYKNFTPDEYDDLIKRINLLPAQRSVAEGNEYKHEYHHAFYNKYYEKDICLGDKHTLEEYNAFKMKEVEPLRKKFVGDNKVQTMMGFIIQNTLHDHKIASMIASLENEKMVSLDMYKEANKYTYSSLESIAKLMERDFTYAKSEGEIKRQDSILNIIKNNQPINQSNLLEKLRNIQSEGKWDFRYNSSLKLLEEMEKARIIKTTKGGKGNVKFYSFSR